MKYMFASDVHGSAYCCRKMLETYKKEQAERLVLLGDLLYHGPRNDLPKEYAPKEVIRMLNEKKNEIYGLKRDSERDMTEIGRLVYERFKQGEVVDTDFIALCEAIEKREEQTEVCEQEIARIKGE